MSGSNRSSLILKLHKVLKQHYKPIIPESNRPLLEEMLFACCLENAPYAAAEQTYQKLATSFFDWNEVRVSTAKELSEGAEDLPDPMAAASNVKRVLQTVFESTYSFDLEALKKQNIGVGIKKLEKLEGATPFVVAHATQYGLGGHVIPLDRGALEVLYIVGIATEAERSSGNVPGLERAIPKNKGREFGSLLHQLAADFIASPFSPTVRNILLAVNPDAKDRLPKRGQKKEAEPAPAPVLDGKAAAKADRKSQAIPAGKAGAKESAKSTPPSKAAGSGKDEKATAKGAASRDKNAKAGQPADKKKLAVKKAPPGRSHEKTAGKPESSGRVATKKSPSKQLAKRKPR